MWFCGYEQLVRFVGRKSTNCQVIAQCPCLSYDISGISMVNFPPIYHIGCFRCGNCPVVTMLFLMVKQTKQTADGRQVVVVEPFKSLCDYQRIFVKKTIFFWGNKKMYVCVPNTYSFAVIKKKTFYKVYGIYFQKLRIKYLHIIFLVLKHSHQYSLR